MIKEISDRVCFFYNSRIEEQGPPSQLFDSHIRNAPALSQHSAGGPLVLYSYDVQEASLERRRTFYLPVMTGGCPGILRAALPIIGFLPAASVVGPSWTAHP
jgi:hypothetical protein